jgi:prepilin-type N-terminal cleavage/methylation domain-containing protein
MRKDRGFSLIELLIVVAIVLIIAAIAIPSLIRAKMNANQSAAVSSLRTLTTAEESYASFYLANGYANTLDELGPPPGGCPLGAATPANSCLVDGDIGCPAARCIKDNYHFVLSNSAGTPNAASTTGRTYPDYTFTAYPLGATSGANKYCVNPDASIKMRQGVITPSKETLASCSTAIWQPI